MATTKLPLRRSWRRLTSPAAAPAMPRPWPVPFERAPLRLWLRRLFWLLALWAGGVATLGLVAWGLKLAMKAAGLA